MFKELFESRMFKKEVIFSNNDFVKWKKEASKTLIYLSINKVILN